jgi:hypothetical protein
LTIQAIETKYKGYRFRSRLEARWAVFFDSIGWPWEYELEGFKLSDGTHYLPDFYLPKLKLWVEIKGAHYNGEVNSTLRKFCKESGCAILLLVGVPGDTLNDPVGWPQGILFAHVKELNGNPKFHTMSCGFDAYLTDPLDFYKTRGRYAGHFCIRIFCPDYKNTDSDLITDLENEFIPYHNYSFYFKGDYFLSNFQKPNNQIISHFEKARSARFEHGE